MKYEIRVGWKLWNLNDVQKSHKVHWLKRKHLPESWQEND